MATFTNANDTTAFNPGFNFSDWAGSISSAEQAVGTLLTNISAPPSSEDPVTSEYRATWLGSGTQVWAKVAANNAGILTISELELSSSSGLLFGFNGGQATYNLNTDTISDGTAKEVWIESPEGYGIDYRGSLSFDIDSAIVSGSLKELNFVARNDGTPEDDGYYLKFIGSVTLNAAGSFSAGLITAIEWGMVTFGENDASFVASGKVAGLKIDATTIQGAIGSSVSGFDGLASLLVSGKDSITGTGGNDTLFAGTGSDKIDGGAGNDHIYGEDGADTITGGLGDDRIWGDINDLDILATYSATTGDKITDLDGNNMIFGGSGNNAITAGSGNDWIGAGKGNDKIIVGGGVGATQWSVDGTYASYTDPEFADLFFDNVVVDWNGNNKITAGDGDDYILTDYQPGISGKDGNNKILAGNGNNVIQSGNGKNSFIAGTGDDFIHSGSGSNKVVAGDGDNWVDLGDVDAFYETFLPSGGLTIGNGKNTVVTGSGEDYVSSWEGNDSAKLGTGSDIVNLGAGKNVIDLGADSDSDTVRFDLDFFIAVLDGAPKTLAFNSVKNFNIGDRMTFYFDANDDDANDFASLSAGDVFIASGAKPLDAAGALLILDTKAGKLYYDHDGAGSDAAVQIGLIKGSGLANAAFDFDSGAIITT